MKKQFRQIDNFLLIAAGSVALASFLLLAGNSAFSQEQKPVLEQGQLSLVQKPESQVQSNRNSSGLQFIGPDTVADVVQQIAPFVVHIDGELPDGDSIVRSRKFKGLRSLPQRDNNDDADDGPPINTGAGVIIRKDGYIVTCNHVVKNAHLITVTLNDGRKYTGKVIAQDDPSDLAIVKIDATNLNSTTLNQTARVRSGDWVIAIGSPYGLDHSATMGIISALNREAVELKNFGAKSGAVRYLQTDAAMNPGNSGGPLVNLRGEIIGINTFIRGDAQNIGFAIPSQVANTVTEALLTNGIVPYPYVGIHMDEKTNKRTKSEVDRIRQVMLSRVPAGVILTQVDPDSPAYKANLKENDIILEVDGEAATNARLVSAAVRKAGIGNSVNFKIWRDGKEQDIKVLVEQLPEDRSD
jgi:S1-C subfamily serine protease